MKKHKTIEAARAIRDVVIVKAVQDLRRLCAEHGFACIIEVAAQVDRDVCAVSELSGDYQTLGLCYRSFKTDPNYHSIKNAAMGVQLTQLEAPDRMNELIDRAGVEFVDFMNDKVPTSGTHELIATDLYNEYVKDIPEKFRPRMNEFTTRVRMWVDAKGYIFNPQTHGERDRRNSTTYFTILRPAPASAQ